MRKIASLLLLAGLLVTAAPAQTLTCVTSGTVQRIPGTPFIPGCTTVPEVHYFAVTGTISQAPSPTEEIVLLVRPRRYDGSTIPGCTWVAQCQRGFVLPDNSFVVIAQIGTNGEPRSWFAGQQADIQFILVPRGSLNGVCVNNPGSVATVQSNINTVNIDPNLPTLHDYAMPCNATVMDVTGTPSPSQGLSFMLPSQGWIAIANPDPFGFTIAGCQIYFGFIVPPVLVSTDASGALALAIPTMAGLAGADLAAHGILLQGGQLDVTQPTLIQIR